MTAPAVNWSTRRVDTGAGTMAVHVARPAAAGVPLPGLLLLHEAFGVNAHIRAVAERLVGEGCVVAAPNLLHRLDVDTVDYAEKDRALGALARLTTADIVDDLEAAHTLLRSDEGVDADRTAAIGFCFGGRAAVLAGACLPGLACAVSFYGSGVVTGAPGAPIDRVDGTCAPLLLLFGEHDPVISAEQRQQVLAELTGRGVAHEVHVFLAGHAFFNDARPEVHDADAADAAWLLATHYLQQRL